MINTKDNSVSDILSKKGVRYSVPVYQRSFDWGKAELQELVEDLKDSVRSEKKLFLGNFIFDISENSSSRLNDYKIVDGQQRLTTLSITLIALRQQAKKLNETRFVSEIQNLIDNDSYTEQDQGRKIIVSENIRLIFDHISDYEWDGEFPLKIEDKYVKRQVNKVKPIYDFVFKELNEYSASELQAFYLALLNAYVIVVNVEGTDDVFSIFERTNARGLDLNIADLLKNYIFSKGGPEEYEKEWAEIIVNAGGTLQRMLKYFWISRRGHTQNAELYRNLRSYANELGVEAFVTELQAFSRYYQATQSNDFRDVKNWLHDAGFLRLAADQYAYERIGRIFQALKLFRVTQAYPVIYSLLSFFQNSSEASDKQLLVGLEAIEKYHFINSFIAGRVGNEVEKFYAEKARLYYLGEEGFNREIDELMKELNSKKAAKAEFVPKFIETLTYSQKNLAALHYVFDRINNNGTKGGQLINIYNPDDLIKVKHYNVEHFLPQAEKGAFDDDEVQLVDTIGNLLVLPRHSNSSFGSKSPAKKAALLTQDLKYKGELRYVDDFLQRYAAEFNDWDLSTIVKRSNDLANEAYERVWRF